MSLWAKWATWTLLAPNDKTPWLRPLFLCSSPNPQQAVRSKYWVDPVP